MEGGRRRLTLYDQMLTVAGDSREITGLTLNDVLTIHKRASPNPSPAVQLNSRTLLDVIREDEFHVGKERKYWKFLRDRLRLKRSGSIPISIRNTVGFDGFSPPPVHEIMHLEESQPSLRPQISRRNSTRFEPTRSDDFSFDNDGADTNTDTSPPRSLRPQISRHNSTRFTVDRSESFADPTEPAREGTRRLSTALAEERALSAREAVAAQEAADAEAEAVAVAVAETPVTETAAQPVRMSLMDLLEETDRQMGLEGSRYTIADEEEEAAVVEEEEEEEREENEDSSHGGGGEQNCCVCMVRHKGAAFIPCGHTFCRLCSRELLVSRGNCPLCNGFILEILDIF